MPPPSSVYTPLWRDSDPDPLVVAVPVALVVAGTYIVY
jgi:hypothetical protein